MEPLLVVQSRDDRDTLGGGDRWCSGYCHRGADTEKQGGKEGGRERKQARRPGMKSTSLYCLSLFPHSPLARLSKTPDAPLKKAAEPCQLSAARVQRGALHPPLLGQHTGRENRGLPHVHSAIPQPLLGLLGTLHSAFREAGRFGGW